ncbi:MAG: hypothetical protein WA326_11240 [Nitrososphaeraceae archaeon]
MTHSKSYDNNKNNVQSKTNPVVDLNEILSVENASAERILSRIDQTPIQEVTVIKRVQKEAKCKISRFVVSEHNSSSGLFVSHLFRLR